MYHPLCLYPNPHIQYAIYKWGIALYLHSPQECQDGRRLQDSPSLFWKGTESPLHAPHWAANQLPTSGGSEMIRKSKVSVWCGFHRVSYPLLPLVPSWRHRYCQVIQLLHSFVPIFMHCSTGWGSAMPWFAWLAASIAAVVGSCPNVAGLWRSHPHFTTWLRGRHIGVSFIDSNYKVYINKKFCTAFCVHC